jgi:hypothetical protein
MLAALILAAALVQAHDRIATSAFGGFRPYRLMPLLVLMALMVGLLLIQSLLDWCMRRVGRRAGATLSSAPSVLCVLPECCCSVPHPDGGMPPRSPSRPPP